SGYALNLGLAYQMIEDINKDYKHGSEDIDFDEDYVPASKRTYTGFLGFDKARLAVEKMLDESLRMISPFEHTDVLVEFVQMIKENLP
ncbi:MAG TPA: geranyl transferase, partial [Candidatus Syntrophosphaera sp.]|nr:geranyl transferase [Candidatus Syntrophosphaera sp.]